MKPKIDFMIIGAQKCATTTLYDYLSEHGDIFLPKVKEILYFAKNEYRQKGDCYLNTYYSAYAGESVSGGAYVHLMYFPYVAKRLKKYNPSMKVIAVLRNPIDRAYSAYWFAKRNGWETLETFEEAIEREGERQRGSFQEQSELTYLSHGDYAAQLFHFYEALGKDNVKVILTEDLKNSYSEILEECCEFLSVNKAGLHNNFVVEKKSNTSGWPRYPLLQKLLLSHDAFYKKLARFVLPQFARHFIQINITKPLLKANIEDFKYPEMQQNTRQKLRDHFSPLVSELEKVIDRDLSRWKE